MAHLEPEIDVCNYWIVETDDGDAIVPYDVEPDPEKLGDYVEGGVTLSARLTYGVIGRLSAPGFLDCTEWEGYADEGEALEALREMLDDDDA